MARALSRLTAAADLLRPRTLLRTLSRVDRLVDATRDLERTLAAVRLHTDQLMAIERLDWEQRELLDRLPRVLDLTRISEHVRRTIACTPLHCDPFPFVVVENWLPDDVYDVLVRAVPPAIFFADREVSRQRLMVPFPVAPAYSQRVWRFMADEIVGGVLSDALNEKFAGVVADYVRSFCPEPPADLDGDLHPSDGRILLRRPGYVIQPHRDPKWGFVTGLVYLAKPGDNEAHGTQLYRVSDDEEAPNDKPIYFDESRCELARAVPFRANTLLAFLNSSGAHGASIPADAKPASLERYVYQFRLGPDVSAIKRILASMPESRRQMWSGAKAGKADRM